MATDYETKLERFKELVDRHDLTYSYSDDHRVWTRGQDSWAAINEAAKGLDPKDCCAIWNAKVSKELGENEQLYLSTVEHWRTRTDA
jgi:hypothetical protein